MIKRLLVMVDGDIFDRYLTKNNVFTALGLNFLFREGKWCLINCTTNETNAYRKFYSATLALLLILKLS